MLVDWLITMFMGLICEICFTSPWLGVSTSDVWSIIKSIVLILATGLIVFQWFTWRFIRNLGQIWTHPKLCIFVIPRGRFYLPVKCSSWAKVIGICSILKVNWEDVTIFFWFDIVITVFFIFFFRQRTFFISFWWLRNWKVGLVILLVFIKAIVAFMWLFKWIVIVWFDIVSEIVVIVVFHGCVETWDINFKSNKVSVMIASNSWDFRFLTGGLRFRFSLKKTSWLRWILSVRECLSCRQGLILVH